MQPEQLRAARAALNWTLERLAEASGVHRNTLSNFETRRFDGAPEKLAMVRRTLEAAGVIFVEENGQAGGVTLRRFQIGDLVRFRPQTRVRFDYKIDADDVGKVVGVEPHPPAMGPTYMIQVEFAGTKVPYVYRFEYELVKATPKSTEALTGHLDRRIAPTNPAAIIDEFCTICEHVSMDVDLYQNMFVVERRILDLYDRVAPAFFHDLQEMFAQHLRIQFCKITDPAITVKNSNLTTNYLLESIAWPPSVNQELRLFNDRLMAFRKHIEPARNKRDGHIDLSAQMGRLEPLGSFPEGDDRRFLQNLQKFLNVAYGHFHDGGSRQIIDIGRSTDVHGLVRALEKSVIFDQCSKCSDGQRSHAILDFEGRAM